MVRKGKLEKACGYWQITIEVRLERNSIYPQENETSSNELKIMYSNISKQISTVQEERQKILIFRDFSAEVNAYIEGKKPKIEESVKNYDLVIINKENKVF